jgi:1-acyl-sn-glycerol-3-phosphate acyltransferase
VRFFTRYFQRWMSKSFHAVRLSVTGRPPTLDGVPLVVVLNHPSWWDPLFGMVLADLFPGYKHYVPIDARALKQYRIFEPLGFFGVEVGSAEGAIAFLRTASAVLSQPHHALWVTAQGHFCDPRVRPVQLRPGVGHLLRRLDRAVVVPLALEYPFWQERFPEALAHFGSPIEVTSGRAHSVDAWMRLLEQGMTGALDELAAASMTQDPARFVSIQEGRVGIGGVYDWWRRLKARLRGQTFQASHVESLQPPSSGESR